MTEEKTCLFENTLCIRALAFAGEGVGDSDAIDRALAYMNESHIRTLVLDGRDWTLERAAELPSDSRIVVDGVCVRQADGVLDNIFRPDGIRIDPADPFGYPFEICPTENIRIQGINGAVLEGPAVNPKMYHPVLGEMQETLGDYWGWRGFLVFFTRCAGFELSGFTLRRTRSWAISMERSKNGYLHDLEIYSDCKNGDGINIRVGCSRIFIENIRACTSDDCIAINSLASETRQYPFKNYVYTLFPSDYLVDRGEPIEDRYIHDIRISNIVSATEHYSEAVAFLTRQGHRIFRVWIHGVYDGNPVRPPKRINMVGAYYTQGYGDAVIRDDDLAEIRIDTVVSNSTADAILFRYRVKDLWINNVVQNCPGGTVLTAMDQELTLTNCRAVSGPLRAPAENWKFIPR